MVRLLRIYKILTGKELLQVDYKSNPDAIDKTVNLCEDEEETITFDSNFLEEIVSEIIDRTEDLNLYTGKDCIPAYLARGQAKIKLELYAEATKDFNEIIKIEPNEAKAHYLISQADQALKKQEDICKDKKNHQKLEKENKEISKKNKNSEEVLEEIYKAYVLDAILEDDKQLARRRDGKMMIKKEDLVEAIENLEKTTKELLFETRNNGEDYEDDEEDEDSNLTFEHCKRGDAYINLGMYEKAVCECDKALELDDENGFAYHTRGEAKYWLGKYKDAIEDFNDALEHTGAEHAGCVYISRAKAYELINDRESAKEDIDAAIHCDSWLKIIRLLVENREES